ncbi:methyltransferase domain-containing protein [soil metagenome]
MSQAGPIPTFEHRDPATAEFWTERYAKAFTPWDQGGVPGALSTALQGAAVPAAPARVLVPGCGSGHELALFDASGYDWLAIDLSALAVEQARARLTDERAASRVRVGDFLALSPAQSGRPEGFDWIYERAFLCALPPTLWPAVIERAAHLLAGGGVWAGLFFIDDVAAAAERRRGPPFAAGAREIESAMATWFDRTVDLPIVPEQSLAAFSGHERWQVWRRR